MTLHDFFGRPVEVSPWDGVTPWGKRLPYPADGLYIDASGCIWYTRKDGSGESAIWCTASRLESHVHHLQQIAAR